MINKKIVLSLLTIFCICASTAGTWASVTDTFSAKKTIGSTGKLELTLEDMSTWHFSSPPILPGESTTASFTLTNTGSRFGFLYIQPVISAVPEELANSLKVTIVGRDLGGEKDLFKIENAYPDPAIIPVGELFPSDLYEITVICSLPSDSKYNGGGSFTVSMDCRLNQRNNYDNT